VTSLVNYLFLLNSYVKIQRSFDFLVLFLRSGFPFHLNIWFLPISSSFRLTELLNPPIIIHTAKPAKQHLTTAYTKLRLNPAAAIAKLVRWFARETCYVNCALKTPAKTLFYLTKNSFFVLLIRQKYGGASKSYLSMAMVMLERKIIGKF